MDRRSLERMAASATPAVVLSAGIDVRSRGRTPTRFDAHPASVPTRIRESGEVSDDQEWAGGSEHDENCCMVAVAERRHPARRCVRQ